MEAAMDVFQQQADAFSSSIAVTGPLPPLPFTPGENIREQIAEHRSEMPWTDHLATYDGEEHAAHRAMMSQLLTHKRLKANEDYVHGLVERLVGSVIERGSCEITEDFAHALSTLVIADLLGVPEEDRQSLLVAMGPDPTQMDGDQGFKVGPDPLIHLHARFHGYLEERLRKPRRTLRRGWWPFPSACLAISPRTRRNCAQNRTASPNSSKKCCASNRL
jgi:cytochrome P450